MSGAFITELRHLEFIKEMARIRMKKVSKLMDIANKFIDGKDTYQNKRTCSPKDDRSHRYSNQKRRPHNYEGYGSQSQVAIGYMDNNDNQGEERRRGGYRSENRDQSGPSKPFRPRTSRDYNQSPEDILNGPCHMHYAYVDGKRVSNHLMRYCHSFLKLQEAAGSKQAKTRNQGYTGTPGTLAYNAPPPPHCQPMEAHQAEPR
jgi:hypothetical protein